jgi:serine/threonine protein kinase
MRDRINGSPLNCAPEDAPHATLPFLIASMSQELVAQYPLIFEFGKAEYDHSIDSFISHIELGEGEGAAIGLDREWLIPFQNCINGTVFQDQHDPSSQTRLRPDFTIVCKRAIALKVESKGREADMAAARAELTDKFHPTAFGQFPAPYFSIFGFVTCPSKIDIYMLSFDRRTGTFTSSLLQQGEFNVRTVPSERIRFVQVIFNIMRWLCSIQGPYEDFHLVPGIRTRSPNGHHITYTSEGILKEYSFSTDILQIQKMKRVYKAKLPNVEWGRVVGERSVMITRIGTRLRTAIATQRVSRKNAEDGVRLGLDQLHTIGYAHCDIKLDNVFVDANNIVFLDDIEYLTPLTNTQWQRPFPDDQVRPVTARDFDEYQFELFRLELLRL